LNHLSDNIPVATVISNPVNQSKGICSLKKFLPGEIITPFSAKEILTQPCNLSLQISQVQHITLDPEYLQFTNHSCDPNVFFDTEKMTVVCIQEINPGDQLRFFYPSTEWEMANPFLCDCGSAKCFYKISGAANMDKEAIKKYMLNQHILQLLT